MGGAVSNVVDTVGDIGQGAIDTAKDVASSDLGKAALIGAGAYYGLPALMGEAGTAGSLAMAPEAAAAYDAGLTGVGSNLGFTGALPAGSAYVAPTVTTLGTVASTDAMGALAGAAPAAESVAPSLAMTPEAMAAQDAALAGVGSNAVPPATSLLGKAVDWATASPQNALLAGGLGLTAAKAIGGSTPSSSTSTTAIDPEMKAAYLRNLEEARTTAAGLGTKQFAAFPTYSNEVVNQYMNPYQQQVIDTTLSDIERQRQQAQLRDRAAAVQAKAFGGSRQGVAEALTNEAYQRTAANTVANLRSQGFTNAQAIALQQEEAKRQYEQQKLDAVRNLGLERLNISQSALGLQPANLGGTQTTPIYSNQTASALGGALSGGMLGNMIGGATGAGYGAAAGGLLGLLK